MNGKSFLNKQGGTWAGMGVYANNRKIRTQNQAWA